MTNELNITLPKEVENLQLPSPELVTYYRNLENRVLWLDTEVSDYWLEFSRNIIEWNREDKNTPVEQRKPIRLMFFSYGGSLDINNTLVDTIKLSKTPIEPGARDFRLMTRQMINAILELKEYNRFSKGIFSWVGFKTKWLEYENIKRCAGETKWNFKKLFIYC